MEKIDITYSSSLIHFLDELIYILYLEEYFSYIDNADVYVDKIYDAIEYTIQCNQYKSAPALLSKHGKFYITYKANNRTTWYAFFNKKGNRYLVRYVTNSHSKDASLLNT